MSVIVEMYELLADLEEGVGSRKTRKYKANPVRGDVEKQAAIDRTMDDDHAEKLDKHRASRGVKKKRGAKMVFGKWRKG
jgi:hypothetical protein